MDSSDIRHHLDMLDNALYADGPGLDGVSDDDLEAVDAWANNVQLDIMRVRRRREGASKETPDGR